MLFIDYNINQIFFLKGYTNSTFSWKEGGDLIKNEPKLAGEEVAVMLKPT